MKHTHIDDNNNNNKYRKFSSKQTYREGGENEICWILMKFCRLFSQHKVHSVCVCDLNEKIKNLELENLRLERIRIDYLDWFFGWKGKGKDIQHNQLMEQTLNFIRIFVVRKIEKRWIYCPVWQRYHQLCSHLKFIEILKFQFYFLFFLFCFQFEWMWTQSGTRSTRTY